ncbi:MAG: hypothetical protein JSW59_17460 [Phycisphaerales bacterium]|nr:MAG: hypothetical protein JSW59_17460 [Phycisphaerales bacterium]
MYEPITVENNEQRPQKPPLSFVRIACQIVTGAGVGLAVALAVACLRRTVFTIAYTECFRLPSALGTFVFVFLAVYGVAIGVGVYLVGTVGDETGSFLLTLGCGLVGGPVIIGVLNALRSDWFYWVASAGCASVPLLLLIPPLMVTLCFNLTRRYKESLST